MLQISNNLKLMKKYYIPHCSSKVVKDVINCPLFIRLIPGTGPNLEN